MCSANSTSSNKVLTIGQLPLPHSITTPHGKRPCQSPSALARSLSRGEKGTAAVGQPPCSRDLWPRLRVSVGARFGWTPTDLYIVRCEVFYMVKKNFQRVERRLSTCRKRTFNTLKILLPAVSDEHQPLVRTAKPPLARSGNPSRRGLPPLHNKSRPTSHTGKSAGKSGGNAADVARGDRYARSTSSSSPR